MRASELTLLDWVKVEKPKNLLPLEIEDMIPKVGRVVGIDGDTVCLDFVDFGFMLDDVSPIMLTPEILEKNGFRKGCYVGGYYSPDCPFRVFTKKDGKCGFTTLFDDEIHFSCIFVHQLQHAMRLYGIEKEIVL